MQSTCHVSKRARISNSALALHCTQHSTSARLHTLPVPSSARVCKHSSCALSEQAYALQNYASQSWSLSPAAFLHLIPLPSEFLATRRMLVCLLSVSCADFVMAVVFPLPLIKLPALPQSLCESKPHNRSHLAQQLCQT